MLKFGGSYQIFQFQKVSEFQNKLFLFARIKSTQRGFSDWKQVAVFIKLSRLNNFVESARYLLEVEKSKSPRRIICLHIGRQFLRTTPRFLKKYSSF